MKSFLKPILAKIILTVILTILFVPILQQETVFPCYVPPCPSTSHYFSIAGILIFHPETSSHGYQLVRFVYIYFVIGLVISYLFSCAIVSVWKRIIKNK